MTPADAKALIAKKRVQLEGLSRLREPRGNSIATARQKLEAEIAALEVWLSAKGTA